MATLFSIDSPESRADTYSPVGAILFGCLLEPVQYLIGLALRVKKCECIPKGHKYPKGTRVARNAVWLFQTNDEQRRNRVFLPSIRRAVLPNGRLRRCGSLMWNDHTALPVFSVFYALWVLVPFGYAYGHSAGPRKPD